MENTNYATLKVADGCEIGTFTKDQFEKVISDVEYRKEVKNDRELFIIKENKKVGSLSFLPSDYIEVKKEK